MSVLSSQQKNQSLLQFAALLEKNQQELLQRNQKDLQTQKGKITEPLYQRLKLDESKLVQLVQAIRDVASLPDPVGNVLWKRKLDQGLILEKRSVPLGVIGIIFESRPDVIPQILALILKSGNVAVLKGGREAINSNRAFMNIVEELYQSCPWLAPAWAQLVETREDISKILDYPQYIDLIIPRGSNEMVRSIMARTKIPVLGHAAGICHIYVHETADLQIALPIIFDAKAQYPAACNAMETLLVDKKIADDFISQVLAMAEEHRVEVRGCENTRKLHANLGNVDDWSVEYGDLIFSLKIVDDFNAAVGHINRYSSHHTDCILSQNENVQNEFLNRVDSASVMVNVSTRFADGFRYGMGAEVGISTSKLHARGPVGLQGLISYKYLLRGSGQIVKDYTGANAKSFLHEDLTLTNQDR